MNTSVKNVDISLLDASINSLIGFALVFVVLLILIVFIKLLSFVISKSDEKKAAKIKAESDISAAAKPEEPADEAIGSCGSVKLYDVPDKTAAMLMAITADKLGEPLNKLRFISIREVNDEEKATK